jgi:hypothetical protein
MPSFCRRAAGRATATCSALARQQRATMPAADNWYRKLSFRVDNRQERVYFFQQFSYAITFLE